MAQGKHGPESGGGLDTRVARTVREAARRVPAFAARLAAAGVAAEEVTGGADLDALPVLSKDELLALQRDAPPFGGLLAPDAAPVRLFQSPGPLYEPQLPGPDPWRWGQALTSLGVGTGDTVLNCFSYHLSPAGAMFDEGATAVGAIVVPGGVGSLELQAQLVADLGVTACIGLPSYLKALRDRFGEGGHDPARWRIRRALVTGEPLPDSLRAELTESVPHLAMAYGTAEAGLLGFEVEPGQGLRVADGVVVQVCDLDSGRPVTGGQEGQVVVTLLRPEYPLVRFGTGDLSAWREGPGGERRLAGVLGRVGEAVKVRGMFLHPRQAAAALAGVPGLAGARFVVERSGHRDALRCEVRAADAADPERLAEEVRRRVRDALRLDTEVVPVADLPDGAAAVEDRRQWA